MKRGIRIVSILGVLVVAVVVTGIAILKSINFNEYKGLVADKVKEATGRELVIAGDLNLEISLTPAVAVDSVSFANAAWGSRPEMVRIGRFAAEVALIPLLSSQVDVKQVILEDVDVLLETDDKGNANWEFGAKARDKDKKEHAAPGETTLPVVRLVRVKSVRFTRLDGRTGERRQVSLDSIDLKANSASDPLSMTAAGSINGQAFRANGTLGSVDQMAGGETFPVKLDVSALAARIGIDGTVGSPDGSPRADIKLSVEGDKLTDTFKAATAVAPALKDAQVPALGAYRLAARAGIGGRRISLDGLDLKVGSTDLSGRLAIAMTGHRLVVDGALVSNIIDIDELAPPSKTETPPPQHTQDDGRVFPADPIPLGGLKTADFDVKLDAKKVLARGLELGDVAATVVLKNAALKAAPLGASVAGGRVSANLTIDGSKAIPSLVAKISGKQVDYGLLMKKFGQTDIASGKVDLNVDVSGRGDSVRAIMAGLNGKSRVVTEGGKVESGLLNIASADILSALPGIDSKGDKDIRCGVVDFRITKGMADARAIVFETGGISVVGTGSINLKDETLDLKVDPRAKKASLATVAMVPLNVTGTLAKPLVAPDAAALAGNVAAGAARTVGAIATLGASLLAEKAAGEASGSVDETDYCKLALAGKRVVPGQMKKAPAPKPAASSEPAVSEPAQEGGGALEDIGKGIDSGLKSLFGN